MHQILECDESLQIAHVGMALEVPASSMSMMSCHGGRHFPDSGPGFRVEAAVGEGKGRDGSSSWCCDYNLTKVLSVSRFSRRFCLICSLCCGRFRKFVSMNGVRFFLVSLV